MEKITNDLKKVYEDYPHLMDQDIKGIVFILLSCDPKQDQPLLNACQTILKNARLK